MSMAAIGESLDQKKTLEAQARPYEKNWRGDICRGCRSNPHPRGFSPSSGLCWYCAFPRPA